MSTVDIKGLEVKAYQTNDGKKHCKLVLSGTNRRPSKKKIASLLSLLDKIILMLKNEHNFTGKALRHMQGKLK